MSDSVTHHLAEGYDILDYGLTFVMKYFGLIETV